MLNPSSPAAFRCALFVLLIGTVSASLPLNISAQNSRGGRADIDDPLHGLGGQVLLTNSGFGLGGYYSRVLGRNVTGVLEVQIGTEKDEREIAFFDRFGRKDLPNKANYLLTIPIHLGAERRLFRSKIEDNFRPFLHVAVGPTVGWKYPYFRDENGNGTLDDDEKTYDVISSLPKGNVELGLGGTVAIGAYFGQKRGVAQSVRIGYTFTHFLDEIEILESSIRRPAHFFGTPIILVSFGRHF